MYLLFSECDRGGQERAPKPLNLKTLDINFSGMAQCCFIFFFALCKLEPEEPICRRNFLLERFHL
jgi:hypothetical protein